MPRHRERIVSFSSFFLDSFRIFEEKGDPHGAKKSKPVVSGLSPVIWRVTP